ncbi:MAG: peptidoglycan-binding domain-containing protein, partial [Ktedonobacterales bacterium]
PTAPSWTSPYATTTPSSSPGPNPSKRPSFTQQNERARHPDDAPARNTSPAPPPLTVDTWP